MSLICTSSRGRGAAASLGSLGVFALAILVSCNFASAQTPPNDSPNAKQKPASEKPVKPTPIARTQSAKPQPRLTPAKRPDKLGVRANAASPRKGAAELEMDPNAKFVCESTEKTLEPVWRTGQDLTFPFSIRNDGTADLQIRAKGG